VLHAVGRVEDGGDEPFFTRATASKNIRSRSSQNAIAWSKNACSSITRSLSAHVSSASPSVANCPSFFARYTAYTAGWLIGIAGFSGIDVDRRHVEPDLGLTDTRLKRTMPDTVTPSPALKVSVTHSE
jgi:hypothetical protein